MPDALTHPTLQDLSDFGLGRLDEAESLAIVAHLDICQVCRETVEQLPNDTFLGKVKAAKPTGSTPVQGEHPAKPDSSSQSGLGKSPSLLRGPVTVPPELLNQGKYQIVRELGRGGMGVVYQAVQTMMDRPVALKVMNPDLLAHPTALPRFQAEVKAAGKLDHPNIVRAYDAEQVGSLHVLVMELVEGVNFVELIKRKGPQPIGYTCHFIRQAALGLQHAFEHHMVHRDIKPHNLMVTSKGVVKILDFGLARLRRHSPRGSLVGGITEIGAFMGTPEYVSPEQATDARTADTRSDLYSLGCTFYFLLTGRPPFVEETIVKMVLAHIEKTPALVQEVRPDVPDEVAAVVTRLLEKDPAKRFQTPVDLAQALAPLVKAGPKREQTVEIRSKAPVESPTDAEEGAATPSSAIQESRIQHTSRSIPRTPAVPGRHSLLPAGVGGSIVLMGVTAWLLGGVIFKGKLQPVEVATRPVPSTSIRNSDSPRSPPVQIEAIALAPTTNPSSSKLTSSVKVATNADPANPKVPDMKVQAPSDPANPKVPDVKVQAPSEPSSRPDRDVPTKSETLPSDQAILELEAAPTVRVRIDGVDIGKVRRYTFRGLKREELSRHEMTVDWGKVTTRSRSLFVRGGQRIRLSLATPDVSLPGLTLELGHTHNVNSVAFSPDGKHVVTGSMDSTAKVWDAGTGQQLFDLRGHSASVNAASYSPDGTKIMTGSYDGTIALWDPKTGRQTHVFKGHTGPIWSAVYSQDGKQILTGSTDTTARLWQVSTGREIRVFRGHTDLLRAVAFSPDGKQVLTGSDDKNAFLWNAVTGQRLREFPIQASEKYAKFAKYAKVMSVAFSPDGKMVFVGAGNGPSTLWEAASGQKIRDLDEINGVHAATFSADGKQLLTAGGQTVLSDVMSGQKFRAFEGNRFGGVRSAAFSPDGTLVLSGGQDNKAKLWDVMSGQELRTFGGQQSVSLVGFTPDERRAVVGRALWDFGTGQPVRFFRHTAMVLSPDSKRVLTAAGDGFGSAGVVWETSSGREVRTLGALMIHMKASFSPDGKQILGGAMSTVGLWDVDNGQQLRSFTGHTASVWSMAFSPDGNRILTGGQDGKAVLWDVQNGQQLQVFQGYSGYQNARANAVAFSPAGSEVLTGAQEGTVLWQAATGQRIRSFAGQDTFTVSFSPDGKQILTGNSDGTVFLWDTASAQQLRVFRGHTAPISTVSFSPNSQLVLTGSNDGTARLWDVATGDELAMLMSRHDTDDWAVVTPAGLFDHSPGGRSKFTFRSSASNKIIGFDGFPPNSYRSGLLAEVWRGERPLPSKK